MKSAIPATIALILAATASLAGPNANTTLVLHAVQTGFGPCEIEDPCVPGPGHPAIEITAPGEPHAIYLLVRNHDNLAALQCAFDWPQDWIILFSLFDCLPTAIFDILPVAPGPISGSLSGAFLCVFGPETAVVGRIHMIPSSPGCLSIIESGFPFGTSVWDCQVQASDPIVEANRGRVCVGPGGINTCMPAATPVENATWGAIKGQYREVTP